MFNGERGSRHIMFNGERGSEHIMFNGEREFKHIMFNVSVGLGTSCSTVSVCVDDV
jgi:hypothetical protein